MPPLPTAASTQSSSAPVCTSRSMRPPKKRRSSSSGGDGPSFVASCCARSSRSASAASAGSTASAPVSAIAPARIASPIARSANAYRLWTSPEPSERSVTRHLAPVARAPARAATREPPSTGGAARRRARGADARIWPRARSDVRGSRFERLVGRLVGRAATTPRAASFTPSRIDSARACVTQPSLKRPCRDAEMRYSCGVPWLAELSHAAATPRNWWHVIRVPAPLEAGIRPPRS